MSGRLYGVTPTFLCHTDQQRCESSGWMDEEGQEARLLSPRMSKGNRTLFWHMLTPGNLIWTNTSVNSAIQETDGVTKMQMASVVRSRPHFDPCGEGGTCFQITYVAVDIHTGEDVRYHGNVSHSRSLWHEFPSQSMAHISPCILFSALVRASVSSWTNCC